MRGGKVMEDINVVVDPNLEHTATLNTGVSQVIETKEDGIEVSTFSVENVDLGLVEKEEPEEDTREISKFNPDELELEDEEKKEDEDEELFCGYDLKKLDAEFNLDDPEDKAFIESALTKLNEQGLSHEQVNCVINMVLEEADKEEQYETERAKQEEAEQYSHEKVQERLKQELSLEEKRNYKSVYSWVKSIQDAGVPSEWITDAMSNPALVKMFHSLYKGATNTNSIKDIQRAETKASNMTPQAVMDNWKAWMGSQKGTVSKEQSKEYLSKFLPMIKSEDMADFNSIFKSILK